MVVLISTVFCFCLFYDFKAKYEGRSGRSGSRTLRGTHIEGAAVAIVECVH